MNVKQNSSVRNHDHYRTSEVVVGIPVGTTAPWGGQSSYGYEAAIRPSAPPMPAFGLPQSQGYAFGGARQPHEFDTMLDQTLWHLERTPRETARRYCLVEQALHDHGYLSGAFEPSFSHLNPISDAHAFKQAWTLAYRATTEAVAHFYNLDPYAYGIPTQQDAHVYEPAETCSRLLESTQRMAPTVVAYEMPKAANLSADQRPSFGGFFHTEDGQNGGVLCSAFIKVFHGPTDATGVHHHIPLMLAETCGDATWSHPGPFPVYQLPRTAPERGYRPFKLDDDEWFVPQHSV